MMDTTASWLKLNLCTRVLDQDSGGHNIWRKEETPEVFAASETAIVICDMWDKHWSRGATERVDDMAPRMNRVIKHARSLGVFIIHAPSDTMDYYAGLPARQRMIQVPRVDPPVPEEHEDPPLPVDASDGGSDTGEKQAYKAWTKQHDAIEIHDDDGISDDGQEIYSMMKHRGIGNMIIMGVHTNMCILGRSFGIKPMVKWGLNVMLVRDLTDAMYNPARPPYVSHWEGTRLVIEYIEKFWCPTIVSDDILNS